MNELRDIDNIYMALLSIKKKYKEGSQLLKQVNSSKVENDLENIMTGFKNWLKESGNILEILYKDNDIAESFKSDLPRISVPTTLEQYKSEKLRDIETKLKQLNDLMQDIKNQLRKIPIYERIIKRAKSNPITAIIMVIVTILAATFGLIQAIIKISSNSN